MKQNWFYTDTYMNANLLNISGTVVLSVGIQRGTPEKEKKGNK